jgi:mono/diheme cytochrome c family protein
MSHDPHPQSSPGSDESFASVLAKAQFFVTGLILAVVATLAYVAGMHSAKGGGHGGESSPKEPPKADVSALLKSTPELLSQGKSVFQINCASCHGATGHGDGPAAAALNPKPRNFTEGYWRYGGGLARVVRTISEGSPGTAMASFSMLPLEDRVAVAHYVRSLSPKPGEDKPEDLAWLIPPGHPGGGGAAESTGVAAGTAPAGPVIPIEKAMAALAEAEIPAGSAASAAEPGPGADLYAQRCASCHGGSGQGGVRVRMLGSSPYAYVVTRSFGSSRGDWTASSATFERLVLSGIPGYVMPANGDLSRNELRDLYAYTQKLRARQDLAARPGS